jgi:hypothetical protein
VEPFSSRKTLPLNLWGWEVAPQADGEDTEKTSTCKGGSRLTNFGNVEDDPYITLV